MYLTPLHCSTPAELHATKSHASRMSEKEKKARLENALLKVGAGARLLVGGPCLAGTNHAAAGANCMTAAAPAVCHCNSSLPHPHIMPLLRSSPWCRRCPWLLVRVRRRR